MITIKLLGGMGNQMFQRAYGLALESRGYTVAFDLSGLVEGTHREYSLGMFETLLINIPKGSIINEGGLQFKPGLLCPPDGSTMVGYWQSEKYFSDITKQVRNKFHFRNLPCRVSISQPTIFVHVRRQDYVDLQQIHGLLSIDYYTSSVEYIQSAVGPCNVLVFSDDIQWCRENLPKGYHFVYGNNKYQDLQWMSICKHAVLSNSSFSWWGAWLGDTQPDRIVVAPKKWFTTPELDSRDIIPERWICV